MKRIVIIFFVLFCLFASCYYCAHKYIGAGFEGRLKNFVFQVSEVELMEKINNVIKEDDRLNWLDCGKYFSEVKTRDDFEQSVLYDDVKSIYQEYQCISIHNAVDNYVLRVNIYSVEENLSKINLISANNYGKDFELSQDIGPSEKKKYIKLFEENIISKIRLR